MPLVYSLSYLFSTAFTIQRASAAKAGPYYVHSKTIGQAGLRKGLQGIGPKTAKRWPHGSGISAPVPMRPSFNWLHKSCRYSPFPDFRLEDAALVHPFGVFSDILPVVGDQLPLDVQRPLTGAALHMFLRHRRHPAQDAVIQKRSLQTDSSSLLKGVIVRICSSRPSTKPPS